MTDRHHTQNGGDETGEGTEGALSVQLYTEQTLYPERQTDAIPRMTVMRQVKELRGLCQYRYTQNRHHTKNDKQTPYPE